jgi:acyl carrier protein phosphodiesterase
VVYDHFLATDVSVFSEESLQEFSENVYKMVDRHMSELPERFARMFPYMKSQNWLFNYRTRWGTESSFGGVVRRARYLEESETAASLLEEHYDALKQCYVAFFPDVKSFAHSLYGEIIRL